MTTDTEIKRFFDAAAQNFRKDGNVKAAEAVENLKPDPEVAFYLDWCEKVFESINRLHDLTGIDKYELIECLGKHAIGDKDVSELEYMAAEEQHP